MPGEEMKYAIVESGGKQYKAVEGKTIDVDRLPVDVGAKVELNQVLMTVDGDQIAIGTPTVSGVKVSTTVESHFKGPKIIVFKYSPRKRFRVRSGHRQQYTRLSVLTIGKRGEARKATKAEKVEPAAKKPAPKPAKKAAETKTTKKPAASKRTTKPATKKPPAEKKTTKAAPKKTTSTKAPAKTTATKKTTTKAPAKRSTTTKPKKTTK
jgi:large subunit ribosomal protein L21